MYFIVENEIKVNEFKIDNYTEKMQQPLIPDTVKEGFKMKKSIFSYYVFYFKQNKVK